MILGQVTGIAADKSSFGIQSNDQNQLTIKVNQNTTYLKAVIPEEALASVLGLIESLMGENALTTVGGQSGLFGQSGTTILPGNFTDLAVGDSVSINAPSGNNNPASEVVILKFQNILHVRGTITAIAASTITITPTSGNPVTIGWDSDTRFLLRGVISIQTGKIANAVYRQNGNIAVIVLVRPSTKPAATPSQTVTPSPSPNPTKASRQVTVDSYYSGKSVTLSVGDILAVKLASNASTGFDWEKVRLSDDTVIQKVSNQYNPPASSLPGAGGIEIWKFKALKKGTSAVFMEYSQPWAGGIKGAKTFSITVLVR